MKVDNNSFKKVTYFNYLGSMLTNDNNTKLENDTRPKKRITVIIRQEKY